MKNDPAEIGFAFASAVRDGEEKQARLLAIAKAYQDATTFHTNRPSAFLR